MTNKDFQESIKFDGRIDRANNVIRRVAVLTSISKNNRLYSDKALQDVHNIVVSGTKSFLDHDGPLGAMNRPVTALRSVAVDPDYTPLGAPVWVEKDGAGKMRRLMIAQDTGSAIKGAQRADIFFGTGDAAGLAAGQLRDPGRMVVLLPIQRAYAMLPEVAE